MILFQKNRRSILTALLYTVVRGKNGRHKGAYKNRDKRLPDVPGRIWYEADINYSFGYRGGERIPYSNDGLIFATYDHYATFVEIV